MRFQVLTAGSMKMAVFCDVAPCSLVEVYRCLRGACCHHQGDHRLEVLAASIIVLMMEAASISETSVNFCQTTRRNISEDSHVQIRCKWENNISKMLRKSRV
jgi:hypothetical protein